MTADCAYHPAALGSNTTQHLCLLFVCEKNENKQKYGPFKKLKAIHIAQTF